jgi:hypothetical protein
MVLARAVATRSCQRESSTISSQLAKRERGHQASLAFSEYDAEGWDDIGRAARPSINLSQAMRISSTPKAVTVATRFVTIN